MPHEEEEKHGCQRGWEKLENNSELQEIVYFILLQRSVSFTIHSIQ